MLGLWCILPFLDSVSSLFKGEQHSFHGLFVCTYHSLSIHHLLVNTWVVVIVNDAATNRGTVCVCVCAGVKCVCMCVCLGVCRCGMCVCVWVSCLQSCSTSGIAGPCYSSVLFFEESLDCFTVCSHQQSTEVPVSLHPCRHMSSLFLFILTF